MLKKLLPLMIATFSPVLAEELDRLIEPSSEELEKASDEGIEVLVDALKMASDGKVTKEELEAFIADNKEGIKGAVAALASEGVEQLFDLLLKKKQNA